jgi:Putative DNA-binding domain
MQLQPEMPVPSLREVQAAFVQGMLAPSLTAPVASGVVDGGVAPERRLALYRNNVLLSLRRVLEGTFPATRRLLGPERFAEIALAFIRSAPPDRPQLLAYGADFPAFVERGGESATVVADVARLEWAREEAYYAADAPPLMAADLAAIPVARYPELRFELHPSLRLIRSRGPVFTLWQAAIDASPVGISAALRKTSAEQVLVVRLEMTVTTRPIAAADLLLLDGLGRGLPLAAAAEPAQATDVGFELKTALALHLAGGTFAGCR